MNLTVKSTPRLTGYFKRDVPQLNVWCDQLLSQLKAALASVSSDDILGLNGDKIDLAGGAIKGSAVTVTDDSVAVSIDGNIVFSVSPDGLEISNSDGSEYVRLADDSISIRVGSIVCDSINADIANIDTLNGEMLS